jgi:hypothetical protein
MFKKLPLTSFAKNSVVEDDCLEIAGTTITLQQGVNLILIAHSQLKLNNGTKISAKGTVGGAGENSKTNAISWIPSKPDQDEKIHCACKDTNCRDGWGHCSANGHSDLTGGRGKPGLPGGNVTIVAREIVLGGTVGVDVSGGGGGPPGQSGHVDCKWNGLQCSSPAAGNGGTGDPGLAGLANYKAGTTTAAASLSTLKAATTPTSSSQTQVVDTNSSLQKAIDDARTAGQTYDNYKGI